MSAVNALAVIDAERPLLAAASTLTGVDALAAHDAMRAAVAELIRAANYALAQHNAPHMFRPESNHWSAVLGNALADIGGAP